MKFCLFHKYKALENNTKICIKCGKNEPLPFFPFGYAILKLKVSCWLWTKRGLQSCPHHGFNLQSWVTGYCKKCGKKEWTEEEIKESEKTEYRRGKEDAQITKIKKSRRFCLGDIHGNHKALVQVLAKAKFNYKKDMLIVLGDIVDGYNCSYECVEELLKVKNIVFIIGNHDRWWMEYMANGWSEHIWLSQGGENTLFSYNNQGYHYKKLPKTHVDFFSKGVYFYELDNMMFVHGGFSYPNHPRNESIETLTWDRKLIERCKNGLKIREWDKIFVGHTTTENQGAKPITYGREGFGKLIQVDCGAGWKGRLCLYNIDTDDYVLSDYARDLN